MRILGLALLLAAGCTSPASAEAESSTSDIHTASSCELDERLLDGVCTKVPLLNISHGTTTIRDAAGVHQATVQHQAYAYRPVPSWTPPSEKMGPCTVSRPGHTPLAMDLFAADAGTLRIHGGPRGTDAMTRGPYGYVSSHGVEELPFHGGETLTAEASGGADFPAFRLALKMPMPLAIEEPVAPLRAGEDLPVAWSGADGTGEVDIGITTIKSATDYVYAQCTVPDTGAWTVPAEVTRELLPDAPTRFVRIDRVHRVQHEPADHRVLVAWVGMTGDTIVLGAH